MFDPKTYKEDVSPEQQKSDNVWVAPPTGCNVVVNTGFQRIYGTGKNGDWKRIKIFSKIAKALDKSKAHKEAEGKSFGHELWADFSKEYNAKKLTALCMAVGHEEPFDPEDDEALKLAICGKPYGLQHVLESRSYKDRNGNDRVNNDFNVVVAKPLSDETLKKFAKDLLDDPDFEKTYAVEVREPRDNRKSKDENGANNGDSFYDDDLPF